MRSKRQGGAGFSSVIVISPLQSIIRDQVVEVNSMGMTAFDLAAKSNQEFVKYRAKNSQLLQKDRI